MRTSFSSILEEGVGLEASDWHIKEEHSTYFRVDGDLIPTNYYITSDMISHFINEITTEENRKIFETTGDLDLSFIEDDLGRFRVNIHKQRNTTALSLRFIKNTIMSIKELKLPPIIHEIANSERGIVFVTGTTGSGKSTTLAAMLQEINKSKCKHIITIEDPIEYDFEDEFSFFEQREIGMDSISFKSALVHALRQDPDIIMVGEMRDRESFEAALQAADTGHLVLTTLHAANASQTIQRILDFYHSAEERENVRAALATNLKAIISQRLIPHKSGVGVLPATEILINNGIAHKVILEDNMEKLANVIETGKEYGMHSFNQVLLEFYEDNLISEETALSAANNPEALKMNMKGIFLSSDSSILG